MKNWMNKLLSKKISASMLVVTLTLAIVLTSVAGVDAAPKTRPTFVTIDPSDVSIEVGESVKLVANLNPVVKLVANLNPVGASADLTWITNDETVATVDGTGRVTGVAAGQALITVKTNNKKIANCTVTVTGEAAPENPGTEDDIRALIQEEVNAVLAEKNYVTHDELDSLMKDNGLSENDVVDIVKKYLEENNIKGCKCPNDLAHDWEDGVEIPIKGEKTRTFVYDAIRGFPEEDYEEYLERAKAAGYDARPFEATISLEYCKKYRDQENGHYVYEAEVIIEANREMITDFCWSPVLDADYSLCEDVEFYVTLGNSLGQGCQMWGSWYPEWLANSKAVEVIDVVENGDTIRRRIKMTTSSSWDCSSVEGFGGYYTFPLP